MTLSELVYSARDKIPHEAGGTSTTTTGITCKSTNCASERYCLHRHVVSLTRESIEHWRHYVAPSPLIAGVNDVPAALLTVHRVLNDRVPPSEWDRCGVTSERLAALGFTINDLVHHQSFLIEDVILGLDLDWERLQSLHFHPSLLKEPHAFPVIALVDPPIRLTATRLMQAFPFGFHDLVVKWTLGAFELAALDFDATTLTTLGMSGTTMIDWLRRDEIVIEKGIDWWASVFRYTKPLHKRLFSDSDQRNTSMEERSIYAQLVLFNNN